MSLLLVPFDRTHIFLLVVCCNYTSILHSTEILSRDPTTPHSEVYCIRHTVVIAAVNLHTKFELHKVGHVA